MNISTISKNDQKIMDFYIKKIQTDSLEYDGNEPDIARILQHWARNKENLYHFLREQLIVKKPINIAHKGSADEFSRIFKNKKSIYDIYRGLPYNISLDWENNCTTEELTIEKKKFPKGTKIYKVLKALFPNKEEELKDFQNEYSKFLDQKPITGNLCLSIHPMDFFTSSDNDYSWKSCMNWLHGGEYNGGTLEMMNSPIVLMAYIEGSKPFYPIKDNKEIVWNNKKWRSYVIFDPDTLMCIVRGYPYCNDDIDNAIFDFIQELAQDKEYTPTASFKGTVLKFADNNGLRFSTHVMYNDFNNSGTKHNYRLNKNFFLAPNTIKDIEYGQEAYCLNCGNALRGEEADENQIFCRECLGEDEDEYCAQCGCPVCSDNMYSDPNNNDIHYCEDCYTDLFFYCEMCGQDQSREDEIEIPYQYIQNGTVHNSEIYMCQTCANDPYNRIACRNHRYYITNRTPTRIYYLPSNATLITEEEGEDENE